MKNILLLNAYQTPTAIAESQLTNSILEIMSSKFTNKGHNVKYTNIEFGYKTEEEIDKHVWADVIIIQTPVYAMSVPWIAKKYFDDVYRIKGNGILWDNHEQSMNNYGKTGVMHGKRYMLSTTWNAPVKAFGGENNFFEDKNVDDIFLWLDKMYQFMGYEKLPTFNCFDVIKNPNIKKDLKNLRFHLDQLIKQRI